MAQQEAIDPSWWSDAFNSRTADDSDGAWEIPEIVSRELQVLAERSEQGSFQHRVLDTLARATSAMLTPDDPSDPFQPWLVLDGRRSPVPGDLDADQVGVLAAAAPLIESPLVRARAADVAWTYGDRRDTSLLDVAVDAYLDVPLEPAEWLRIGKVSWGRAVSLLASRGRAQSDRVIDVVEALRSRLLSSGPGEGWLAVDLADLLRRCRTTRDVTREVSEHLIQLASTVSDNPRLRRHLERCARKGLLACGETHAANECLERIAIAYEDDARQRLASDTGAAMAAGTFLEKAIRTLQQLPRSFRAERGIDQRVATLRADLQQSRQVTLEAMVALDSESVDITKYVALARDQVSGHSRFEALVQMAALCDFTDRQAAFSQARDSLEAHPLTRLFPSSTLSADGRKVGSSASTDPQHLDEQEIWVNVVQAFDIKVGLVTDALLIPGLEVLRSEHHFDLAYLSRLCWDSPVVPPDHVDLWARGLWHGLKGDLPSAISLLVPQIEQFIRQALKAHGVHTLLVDAQTGVETEKGLGALLATPEATALLGENLHLELTALLVEPRSANLRNNIAHGLLHDSAAWSAPAVYAWWLSLRLVVMPLWSARQQTPDPDIGGTTT